MFISRMGEKLKFLSQQEENLDPGNSLDWLDVWRTSGRWSRGGCMRKSLTMTRMTMQARKKDLGGVSTGRRCPIAEMLEYIRYRR